MGANATPATPCGRDFTSAFAGYRWPAEVILLAVRWSLSHPLSATSVTELLAERSINVSKRPVLRWVPLIPWRYPCWERPDGLLPPKRLTAVGLRLGQNRARISAPACHRRHRPWLAERVPRPSTRLAGAWEPEPTGAPAVAPAEPAEERVPRGEALPL